MTINLNNEEKIIELNADLVIDDISLYNSTLSIVNNSDSIYCIDANVNVNMNNLSKFNIGGKIVSYNKGEKDKNKLKLNKDEIIPLFLILEDADGKSTIFLKTALIDDIENVLNGNFFIVEEDDDYYYLVFKSNIDLSKYNLKTYNIWFTNRNGTMKLDKDSGAAISFNKVVFYNTNGTITKYDNVLIQDAIFEKSIYATYLNKASFKNVHIVNDSSYASGFVLQYAENINIDNLSAQTKTNYAVLIQYCKNILVKNINAFSMNKTNSNNAACLFDTVSNSEFEKLNIFGDKLSIANSNKTNINKIEINDSFLKDIKHSSTYNVSIINSSDITIKDINVQENGSANSSLIKTTNSSRIFIDTVNSNDKNNNMILDMDVVYDSKFINFNVDCKDDSSKFIDLNSKNNNILLQSFIIKGNKTHDIIIQSPNTKIKNIRTNTNIKTDAGAINSIVAEQLKDNKKIISIFMQKNNYSKIKKDSVFSYDGHLYLSPGDVVEITIPYPINFHSIEDFNLKIISGDAPRVFVKVKNIANESDFILLSKDKIPEINNYLSDKLNKITIRFDGNALEEQTIIEKLDIIGNGMMFNYPIAFSKLKVFVPEEAVNAKVAIMTAESYLNGKGQFLIDKDYEFVVAEVDGSKEFEIDTSLLNVKDLDTFRIAAVMVSSNLENQVVYSYLDPVQTTISFKAKIDKGL